MLQIKTSCKFKHFKGTQCTQCSKVLNITNYSMIQSINVTEYKELNVTNKVLNI